MDKKTKVNYKQEIEDNGYSIIDAVFSSEEVEAIIKEIDKKGNSSSLVFRKSKDLFAIRQFLKEIPSIKKVVFNNELKAILKSFLGENFFVIKSIYFDKPEESNWFVAYHQDLTISVDKKVELDGFTNWTTKQNQFSVQPKARILEEILTIRIHLDNTDENNGALKVIPKSHKKGIERIDTFNFHKKEEKICSVKRGGIMIMKPLLFHASNKTTNKARRRVIHIEFSNITLPEQLAWSEKISIN